MLGAYVCFHFAFRTLIMFTLVVRPLLAARLRIAISVVCKGARIEIAYLSQCGVKDETNLLSFVALLLLGHTHTPHFLFAIAKHGHTKHHFYSNWIWQLCWHRSTFALLDSHNNSLEVCWKSNETVIFISYLFHFFRCCCLLRNNSKPNKKIDGKSRRYHHIFSTQTIAAPFFPLKFWSSEASFFLFTWDFGGIFPLVKSNERISSWALASDKLGESTWIKNGHSWYFIYFRVFRCEWWQSTRTCDGCTFVSHSFLLAVCSLVGCSCFRFFLLVTSVLIVCVNWQRITFEWNW